MIVVLLAAMGSAVGDNWRGVNRRAECAIAALRRLPYREYLATAHWQRIRAWALDRAPRGCALCPATTKLQVHHRSYARRGFEQPEDVIVLCDTCHQRHHRQLALAGITATGQPPLKAHMLDTSESDRRSA